MKKLKAPVPLIERPMALVGKTHPALHRAAEPVTEHDRDLEVLCQRMFNTLQRLPHGAALAAPQVGHSLAVVVTRDGYPFINPQIETSGHLIKGAEGCLSLPGQEFEVERWSQAEITGVSLDGRQLGFHVEGFEARLWQHEIDHLNGKLLSST